MKRLFGIIYILGLVIEPSIVIIIGSLNQVKKKLHKTMMT